MQGMQGIKESGCWPVETVSFSTVLTGGAATDQARWGALARNLANASTASQPH